MRTEDRALQKPQEISVQGRMSTDFDVWVPHREGVAWGIHALHLQALPAMHSLNLLFNLFTTSAIQVHVYW